MPAAQPPHSNCTVDLKDQVALVTGASRGIGRAIAIRLAACGAKVAGVARSAEGLAGTLQAIRDTGGEAEGFAGDVGNPEDVQRIVEAVEAKFGAVHILVNNAGITRDGLMLRMDDADWNAVITTNLNSVFYFTKAVGLLMMRQRYGRIVNITSVSGLKGNPGQANYSASKAGVIGFTRTVARELAGRGITVNAVAPGFIATEMTKATADRVGMGFEDFKAAAATQIPVARVGEPEDIANAIAFFTGEAAGFVSGQVLYVAGGPLD